MRQVADFRRGLRGKTLDTHHPHSHPMANHGIAEHSLETIMRHILTMGLFLLTLIPAPAAAQPQWVQLGCRDVDLNVDRDVIRVGRRDGKFTAIRLRAAGNAVQMLDLKVVYGNGAPDDIPVRARIPEGGTSGVLDLRGRERAIDRIEMLYARVPNFRGRASICVEGRLG
jgi:hypothetical protein